MTTDQSVGSPYDIKGYPTLKFFGTNKSSPKDYGQERKASDMATFLLHELRQIVHSKLGMSTASPKSETKKEDNSHGGGKDDKSVKLTNDNFESEVSK